jgi:hypothetical protein
MVEQFGRVVHGMKSMMTPMMIMMVNVRGGFSGMIGRRRGWCFGGVPVWRRRRFGPCD